MAGRQAWKWKDRWVGECGAGNERPLSKARMRSRGGGKEAIEINWATSILYASVYMRYLVMQTNKHVHAGGGRGLRVIDVMLCIDMVYRVVV